MSRQLPPLAGWALAVTGGALLWVALILLAVDILRAIHQMHG